VRKSWIALAILAMFLPVLFMGCAGDDGAQGLQGIEGPQGGTGPPGSDATTAANPESCAVCHGNVAATHAATGVASISNVASALDGDTGILEITFNLKVDGVNNDAYTVRRAYVNWDNQALATDPNYPGARSTFQRDSLSTTADVSLAASAGNYTVTVVAGKVIDDATYLFQLTNAAGDSRPVVVATNGTRHLRDLVSNDGCKKCHGETVFRGGSHYASAGEDCQICHTRAARSYYNAFKDAAGNWDTTTYTGWGGNLPIYVHGVHNSHNMPAGVAYFHGEEWSVGYPSDMRNCVSCHVTTDQLSAAVEAPVSRYLCFSCHQSWDGFVDHDGNALIAAGNFHRTLAADADCMACHGLSTSMDEAGDFHSSFESTDAHYNSFYRGKDISFENPDNISFQVTGVTKTGDNVTFTWTASKNGVAVDPCNTNIDSGPVFSGSNVGAYLSYAIGDDWVNDGVGTSPGQPLGARNLFSSLTTTCASNVATTTGLTISSAAAAAEKVVLAIGGKAKAKHAATGNGYFVRFPSPTYAFNMADGSAATARRNIVDNAKCTGCHAGTMYQHGGDRIDNVQLCVICHNPSSNDKNNRLTRYQIVNADGSVNTNATYDGKTAESYDLRYMLHAIHGVGFSETTWVIYRSRGVYAFATEDMAKPTGWPTDGMTIYGSTNGSTIAHNWTVIHYPQPVNDCLACHNAGTYEVPDQTKAVALTVDAGTSWADQSDDISIGPAAAACTSCHNSAPVRSHAITFGYKAIVDKYEMILLSL